jgi:RNA polymerase sigma-70 factor, ECF subfamily
MRLFCVLLCCSVACGLLWPVTIRGRGALYNWQRRKRAMATDSRQAVLALFEEHGAAIYRFALVLLRHHHDAEDVVQETYVKLLDHLQALRRSSGQAGDGDTNLRGWLFTVAANACRDRMRRRSRWIPWTPVNDSVVEPPLLHDEDGRVKAVRQAMSRLPARDRLLVALRAQGLSYREIAAAAQVRPVSVGRLLARALKKWERAYAAAPALPHAYGRSSS